MEEDITKPPKGNRWDVAYHALKIALGVVGQAPGVALGVPVSVPASDFLAAILDAPVNRRRDAWVRKIATRIVELEAKVGGFDVNNLQENETFVSAFLHASGIAARTHHEEKLEALANAVMRAATSESADEDISQMYLYLVDRLTPSHIVLLSYFNDHFRWMEARDTPGAHIENGWITNFDEAIPDFKGRRFHFYAVIQDLINLGLLREKPDDSYRTESMLGPGFGDESPSEKRERRGAYKEDLKSRNLINIWEIEVTVLGKAFLDYISNPQQEDGNGAPH
jgi:hypothetical protein